MLEPLADFHARDALLAAGVAPADLGALTRIGLALARAVFRHDLLLAELNPLTRLIDGRFVALDAHVKIDDDASAGSRSSSRASGNRFVRTGACPRAPSPGAVTARRPARHRITMAAMDHDDRALRDRPRSR